MPRTSFMPLPADIPMHCSESTHQAAGDSSWLLVAKQHQDPPYAQGMPLPLRQQRASKGCPGIASPKPQRSRKLGLTASSTKESGSILSSMYSPVASQACMCAGSKEHHSWRTSVMAALRSSKATKPEAVNSASTVANCTEELSSVLCSVLSAQRVCPCNTVGLVPGLADLLS